MPVTVALALVMNAGTAVGDESVEQLRKDIKQQQLILDDLENRLQQIPQDQDNGAAPASPSAVNPQSSSILNRMPDTAIGRGLYDPDFAKSAPLFDSNWRFAMGGYAKVDLFHEFDGGDEYEFLLSSIPVNGDPQPGSFTRLQMNETRFNFEMRNGAAGLPPNRVFLEFDFFDKSSPNSARLRHAYFQYGKLLAGRNWTTLSELRQLPLLLDFAAGDSLYGGRTTQLRWEETDGSDFDWAVALEDYADDSIYNPSDVSGTARSNFPRLVLRGSLEWAHGVATLGGSLSEIRFDGTATSGDVTELGWAIVTGGRVYLDKQNRHFFGFGASYGEGTASNILTFANGGVPNAAINADGTLDLTSNWNLQLSLHWKWSRWWSSNFNYAVAQLSDVPDLFEPDWIRDGRAIHANIIHKHSDVITYGLEYMTGKRENVNGEDGSAQRLQASIFYYF